MSKTAVTIEWVLLYSVSSLLMAGLVFAMLGDEAKRHEWIGGVIFLAILGGLSLIIWQGVQGHLPGTGVSARGFFPLVARFIAWAGGLAILGSAVGALIGYGMAWGNWGNRDFAIGLILFPCMAGGVLGFVAGAVTAVVKAFR